MKYFFVSCLFVFIFFPQSSRSQHDHWISKYRGASGGNCCGRTDCRTIPVRVLVQDGTQTTVEVGGVVMRLPAQSVHVSEDMESYWCLRNPEYGIAPENTRCVFFVVAM